MDFDFTTETITPDTTTILTIGGSGALELPSGITSLQPVSAIAGAIRWNTTNTWVEYFNGVTWNPFATGASSVTSITGTANQITASASTGAVTLSTPATFIAPGSIASTSTITAATGLTITAGGALVTAGGVTVSTLTANSFLYSGTAGLLTTTTAPIDGQLIIGRTGLAPILGTVAGTAGNITSTAGAGTIVLNLATAGTAGTYGQVTTDTFGRVVTGTVITPVANGGTGAATLTANGVLLGNGTTAVSAVAVGATGTVLSGNTGAAPTWTNSPAISGANITATTIPNASLVNSSITIGSTSVALGGTSTSLAGMTGIAFASGTVTGLPSPTNGTDATNKNYVDAAIAGLSWKQAVKVTTTINETLATAFAATQVIDGVTLATGDRILIKNQTTQTDNGIYIVQASGAPVRATDADTGIELVGATVYVDQGTLNADTGWTQTTNAPITIGTTNIIWAQFSGSGSYTAGTGLTLSGNQFSLTSPVAVTLGGTGTTTAPASGQVLVGTSGGIYAPATVASGTGISTTVGSGTLQINNTGVTSAVATAGNITVSAATGAVTFNLATAGTAGTYGTVTTDAFGRVVTGTVITPVTNGGTGVATLTANALVLGNGTTAVSSVAVGASATFLSGNTGAAPTFRAIAYTDLPIKLYVENPSTPTAPTAVGTNAVAIGSGATAPGATSIAFGAGTATIANTKAFANGSFATAGDAQSVLGVLRNITTAATATELFLDGAGASSRMVLPNNSVWTFVIKVSARRTDNTGGVGSWIFQGVIYKDATAATTVIPTGAVSKTTIARVGMTSSNDPTVTADTTNGSLKVTVIGTASQTHRWVATVELSQVTN